jgi:hypothetical protein
MDNRVVDQETAATRQYDNGGGSVDQDDMEDLLSWLSHDSSVGGPLIDRRFIL